MAHPRETAPARAIHRIDERPPLIRRETEAGQLLTVPLETHFVPGQRQRLHPWHRLRLAGGTKRHGDKDPEENARELHDGMKSQRRSVLRSREARSLPSPSEHPARASETRLPIRRAIAGRLRSATGCFPALNP
jgi:hypothetical protein